MEITNEIIKEISLDEFYEDLLILIIIKCSGLSKFMMHLVSKKLQKITQDNKQNRKLGISFATYFIQNKCKGNMKNKICELAAGENSLSILKWARENGENDCNWDSSTCSSAALGGHLEVLKWARGNSCECSQK